MVSPLLDEIRPTVPAPPSRFRVFAHRTLLCAAWAVGLRRVGRLDRWLEMVAPTALAIALAAPAALVFDGSARALAVGVCLGLTTGAFMSWALIASRTRSAATELVTREAELLQYADDRAHSVARQLAWSVDEVIELRAGARQAGAQIGALTAQLELARSEIAGRDRALVEATQKIFELGALAPERDHERIERAEVVESQLRESERVLKAQLERKGGELADATRRVAELTATLRRIGEASRTVERRDNGRPPLTFTWKLQFDGATNVLQVQLAPGTLVASRARALGPSNDTIALSEGVSEGHAGRDHAFALTVPDDIAGRVRRGEFDTVRIEFQAEGEWLRAVPQRAGGAAAHGTRSQVPVIDTSRRTVREVG